MILVRDDVHSWLVQLQGFWDLLGSLEVDLLIVAELPVFLLVVDDLVWRLVGLCVRDLYVLIRWEVDIADIHAGTVHVLNLCVWARRCDRCHSVLVGDVHHLGLLRHSNLIEILGVGWWLALADRLACLLDRLLYIQIVWVFLTAHEGSSDIQILLFLVGKVLGFI